MGKPYPIQKDDSDFSEVNDQTIPMPGNFTGPTADFSIIANADGRRVDCDPYADHLNAREF